MIHALAEAFALVILPIATILPQDPSSVLRVYDVTAAAPVAETQQGSAIPLVRSTDGDDLGPIGEVVRAREFCLEVLRELQPEEWEVPERQMELTYDGRLLVFAPPALQESVAQALVFFGDTFGRPARLVVDLVSTQSADADALPALLPLADIARWTAPPNLHQSYEVAALPGARGWVQALRSIDIVRHYELEIAERAASFHAAVERLDVGLSIECASAPAPGGTWLALNVQDVTPIGGVEEVEMRTETSLVTDHNVITTAGPRRVQRVRLDERLCALNAFLPDGKALVIRTTLGSGNERTTRILFVHMEGGPTGAITRLPEPLKRALGSRDAALVRTDSYAPPRATLYAGAEPNRLPALGVTDDRPYGRLHLELHTPNELIDRLRLFDGSQSFASMGVWAVIVAPDRASNDASLARVSPLLAEPRAIQVALTLRRGPRGSPALASAMVPLRVAARSTVVLLQETTAAAEFQSYIAQAASAVVARVSTYNEGLAVGIDPRFTASGDLMLTVAAHARIPRGPAREFDPGTSAQPLHHQQDVDRLDFERVLTFAKSEKVRRATLGNSGSGDDALTLEIEVVDLR